MKTRQQLRLAIGCFLEECADEDYTASIQDVYSYMLEHREMED